MGAVCCLVLFEVVFALLPTPVLLSYSCNKKMASPKPRWGGAPSDKCTECGKTVYPAEKLVMEGRIFHIKCLRCQDELCNKLLTGANWGGFMPPDDKPYCKIHF